MNKNKVRRPLSAFSKQYHPKEKPVSVNLFQNLPPEEHKLSQNNRNKIVKQSTNERGSQTNRRRPVTPKPNSKLIKKHFETQKKIEKMREEENLKIMNEMHKTPKISEKSKKIVENLTKAYSNQRKSNTASPGYNAGTYSYNKFGAYTSNVPVNVPSTPNPFMDSNNKNYGTCTEDYLKMVNKRNIKMNVNPCKKNLFMNRSEICESNEVECSKINNDAHDIHNISCISQNNNYKPIIRFNSNPNNSKIKINEYYLGYNRYNIERVSDIRTQLHEMYDLNRISGTTNHTNNLFNKNSKANNTSKLDSDKKKITFKPRSINNSKIQDNKSEYDNCSVQNNTMSLLTNNVCDNSVNDCKRNTNNCSNLMKLSQEISHEGISPIPLSGNRYKNNNEDKLIMKTDNKKTENEVTVGNSQHNTIANEKNTLTEKTQSKVRTNSRKSLKKNQIGQQNLFNQKAKVNKNNIKEREKDLRMFAIFTEELSKKPEINPLSKTVKNKNALKMVYPLKENPISINENNHAFKVSDIETHTKVLTFGEEEMKNVEPVQIKKTEEKRNSITGGDNNSVDDMKLNSMSKAYLEEKLKQLKEKFRQKKNIEE